MGEQHQSASPLILFYSYAQEDELLRNELEKHLSLLQRQKIITTWHNRQIAPGTSWTDAIDAHLKEAAIILLLISPDFLASDYCYSNEMQLALKRHKQGLAHVIPILLRPVDWQDAPFSHLHPLPSNKQPVTLWESRDAAFLDIVSGIRTAIIDICRPMTQATSRSSIFTDQQNRQRLLKRVRAFWIQGMLEKSLHQAALIALGLQHQPDALANPWRLIVQEVEQTAHALPAGTHITQVYDEADGALLILGDPGSGKTTLLLELARDLLERAERDETYPMPVVFNLSSWAEKRQPLTDWLTEELNLRYQVPLQLARSWVATEQILPLLDGLDEVAPTHMADCLEAINIYRGEHDLASLVVCSRSKEYFSQKLRILLQNAVTVQPLTLQQIDEYLGSAGEQLLALRTTIHEDEVLLKLATNPLMLSVLTLTYRGKTAEELTTTGSLQVRRRKIFAAYVQRMFEHRGVVASYDPQQTIRWLQWLASQMALHNQTEFYLESMQPDWLWQKSLRQCYEWLVGRPIIYLWQGSGHALYSGLLAFLVTILVSSLSVTIDKELFGALIAIFPGGVLISVTNGIQHGWRKGFATAMIGFPIGGVYGALISMVLTNLPRPGIGLIIGLITGMIVGLLSSIIGGITYAEISVRPVLGWSWEEVRRSFKEEYKETLAGSVIIAVPSVLLGIIIAIKSDIFSGIWIGGIWIGGIALLLSLLFVSLASGMQSKALSKQVLITPNQGIRLLARKGLYGFLIGGLVAFLCTWLFVSHFVVTVGVVCWLAGIRCYVPESNVIQSAVGWSYWLIAGILLGILGGLSMGWGVCVRHLMLRVLLWRTGSFPLNPARFLDYAAERILLRKIGGGYIFIHRLLLEYFALAMMETETIQTASRDTKDPGIYYNRGDIFAAFREDDQAIKNYTRAIELNPRAVSVYADRGLIYVRQKKYLQAVADFTSAIKLDPKSAWLYRQRGLAYRELKEYEKAIADFSQSIELKPDWVLTYKYRGRSYYGNKESAKAIADFSHAIKQAPQEASHYRDRGQLYIDLEEYENAIADLTKAVELAPQNARFYSERSSVYIQLQEYEKAIDDLNYAIKLQPSEPHLYDKRGSVFLDIYHKQAIADYNQAIEQAIADYNQAIELDTEYVNAYLHRGSAFLLLKQSELACADFTKYTSFRPKESYSAWMAVYAGLNRQHPGIEVAERLETIATFDTAHHAAYICRGVALGLRGKLHEGLAELEQALQSDPEDATVLFWRGMIYAYLGQDAQAIQTIAQALDAKLSPVLLTPLYWLFSLQPEVYQTVAVPFLTRYDV